MDDDNDMQMEQEAQEILYEIADIKGQIAAAKAQSINGNYSDPVWFAKANSALRYKQARHQELLRVLAAKRREKNAYKARAFEAAFITAARHVLDKETFASVWAAAMTMNEAE